MLSNAFSLVDNRFRMDLPHGRLIAFKHIEVTDEVCDVSNRHYLPEIASQDYFCTITFYGYSSSFQSLFATGAHLFNFQLPINGDWWFGGMMDDGENRAPGAI